MEQLIIIIVLLITIVLLLLEKKPLIKKYREEKEDTRVNLPSIIGDTKKEERQSVPSYPDPCQSESNKVEVDIFESETNSQGFDNNNPKKKLDEILVRNEVWEGEEEDWLYKMEIEVESGFATGVTFQELSTANQLLQYNVLEPDLKKEAVDIIQKIHGTELFNLLEESLGKASRKVDDLLNLNYQNDDKLSSSKFYKGVDGFDIREFV